MVVECPMNRRKPRLPGRVLLLYAGTSWVYAVVVASQVAPGRSFPNLTSLSLLIMGVVEKVCNVWKTIHLMLISTA